MLHLLSESGLVQRGGGSQDRGTRGGKHAAVAVDERDLVVLALPLAALAAQLARGFYQEEDAEHAGMAIRQAAAGSRPCPMMTHVVPEGKSKISA